MSRTLFLRSLRLGGLGGAIAGLACGHTHLPSAQAAPSPQQHPTAALFALDGRKALVTGGSKGLGEAIARGLAAAGCDVIITSRSEDDLRAAKQRVQAAGTGSCDYIVCDLSNESQARALGPEVLRRFGGRCDIFIDNAGVSMPGSIHKGVDEKIPPMTDESWGKSLATNCEPPRQSLHTRPSRLRR
eukprot:4825060-Prymnesium_polylepis.1